MDEKEAKRIAASISGSLGVKESKASQAKPAATPASAFFAPRQSSSFNESVKGAGLDVGRFAREVLQGSARSLVGLGNNLLGRERAVLPETASGGERAAARILFGREEQPTATYEGYDLVKAFGADEQLARNIGPAIGVGLALVEFSPFDEIASAGKNALRGTKNVARTAAKINDPGAILREIDRATQRLPRDKQMEAAMRLADITDEAEAGQFLSAFLKDNRATAYDFSEKEALKRMTSLEREASKLLTKADSEIATEAAATFRQINATRKIAEEAGTSRAVLNDMLATIEDAYSNLATAARATGKSVDDIAAETVRKTRIAANNPGAVKAGFDVVEDGRITPRMDDAVEEAKNALKLRAVANEPVVARLSDIENGRFPRPVEGDALIAELGDDIAAEIAEALQKYPGGTVVRGIYAADAKSAGEQWVRNVARGENPDFGNMEGIAIRTSEGEIVAEASDGGRFFSEAEIQAAMLDGKKERGFVTTIKESPYTSPELARQVESIYDPLTNKETLAEAASVLGKGDDEAFEYVMNAKSPTATSNAVAELLIEKFQGEGKMAQAIQLVETVAERATAQGQAIQALALWNRLTPAGVLRYADKTLKNAGKKLTPDLSKKLVDMAQAIKKMDAGWEKSFETAKMLKLITDEVPVTRLRKISTLQSIMLLLNPKTWIRNLIGNSGFAGLEQVSDVAAAGLDSAMSLVTGVRTKVPPDVLVQSRGALKGAMRGWKEAMAGVNTIQTSTQFDIPQTATFKSKELLGVPAALEKALNVELRVPDRMFYQAAYDGSIYNQLKAYNLTQKKRGAEALLEPTPDMIEIATHDALYRTFQDDSAIATGLVKLKSLLNGGKDFGLGDVLIKFPKTPGNLLSRGIDYSPIGFVNMVYQASRPLMGKEFNQRKFVEAFGRAATGSAGLVGTGLILQRLGILSGGQGDKPLDVKGAERITGLGDYKINVSALKRFALSGMEPEVAAPREGDTLVTYDWFQPAAVPIVVGANIAENQGVIGGTFLGDVFDAVLKGADALVEQPVLQNLNKFAEDTSYYGVFGALGKQLANVPASFVPTLFNQVRQLMDNDSRNTYSPDTLQYAMNLAKARVPGLSETLPRRYTTFGDQQEVYQEGSNNFLNVFFNPLFATKYKNDPAVEMVLDVYKDTGDTGAVPDSKRYKQTVNGETVQIGPKTYERFSRFVGQETRRQMFALSQDPAFTNLEPEKQVDYIANVIRDVHAYGKIVVLGDRPKKPGPRVRQLLNRYAEQQP